MSQPINTSIDTFPINEKHPFYIINTDDKGNIIWYNKASKIFFNEMKPNILKLFNLEENVLTQFWQKENIITVRLRHNNCTYIWTVSHAFEDNFHQLICHDISNITIPLPNDIVTINDVFNNIPYYSCIIDIMTLTIFHANRHWIELGYQPSNNTNLLDYIHEEDHYKFKELKNVFTDDGDDVELQVKVKYKNNAYLSTVWKLCQIQNKEYIMIGSVDKITTLKTSDASTGNNDTFNIISKLIHEIKTPLNSIIGFAQLTEMTDSRQEIKEYINIIGESSRFLLKLVNDILDYSRLESNMNSHKFVWIDLWDIISNMIEWLHNDIQKKQIVIDYDYDNLKGIKIWGEIHKFKQIFVNLMSNAIKYNKLCGTIHIMFVSCQKMSDDDFAMLGYLQIKDTGIGIAKEKLPMLFQPFNRLGRENSIVMGTGLGLYITQKICHYHQWEIDIQSQINEYTCATIRGIKYRIDDNKNKSYDKNIIIYVEDNIDNCKLMRKIMNRWKNIELITTPHGQTGMNLATNQNPILIFLDLNLPDIGGATILKTLRDKGVTTPIYVISADNTVETMKYIKSLGCTDYITKPIFVEEIVQIVERYNP